MKSIFFNLKGFSRAELLVVVGLIIFMVIIFANFVLDTQQKIRDAVRRGDIESMARVLEVHYNRTPNEFCPNSPIDSYCVIDSNWFSNKRIPVDPLTKTSYSNLPKNGDKTFLICAKLEKGHGDAIDLQGHPGSGVKADYYCNKSQQ